MSYIANVYNVMIASPGDVAEERRIIREMIAEWNTVNSQSRSTVLLPVGFETHVAPEMGARPQAIINSRVLRDCDLLVGVFWTRIGTATGEHASGTVEEIEEHIKANRPAMLYFSSRPVDPESVDPDQYRRLKEFRAFCETRGLVEKFSDSNDFRNKLYRQLQLTLNDGSRFPPYAEYSPVEPREGVTVLRPLASSLSHEAQTLLKVIADDPNGRLFNVQHLGGRTVRLSEKKLYEGNDARQNASWDAIIRELANAGLIEPTNFERSIFVITKAGYDVADEIRL